MLQNKQIFKKILPFLFLFILSLGYVTVDLFKRITAPSQAADGDIRIDLQAVKTPLSTHQSWEWNVSVFVDSYFKDRIDATYQVDWCGNTYGKDAETGCNQRVYSPDYKIQITSAKIPIQAKSTVSRITHQSIDCGRVELSIQNEEKLLANKIFDTGIRCPDAGKRYMNLSNIGTNSNKDFNVSSMVRKFLNIFPDDTSNDDKTDDEDYKNNKGSEGSGNNPGNPGRATPTPGGQGNGNLPSSYGPVPNRPYYDPQIAPNCYTPEKFNEVYGTGNSNTGSCWRSTQSAVESQMKGINFLGKSIRVHGRTANAFENVSRELEAYRISGSLYKFSQGEYNFSSSGTYNFRCNVNSSSSQDLCDPNCNLSTHAFGISVDLNAGTNANGSDQFDMPPEAVHVFENNGFRWGGRYKQAFGTKNDAMHFEYLEEVCG